MALDNIETLQELDLALQHYDIKYKDCRMGELGNCLMLPHKECWKNEYGKIEFWLKLWEFGNGFRYIAKDYFLKIKNVKEHISMDMNGKDGAKVIDLRKPVNLSIVGNFDIITNFGTSEHVESIWPDDQYMAFKNIHDMCKKNGIMYHQVPKADNWQPPASGLPSPHCPYYYYEEFFEKLALENGYEIYMNKSWNHDMAPIKRARYECAAILVKKENRQFCTKEIFSTFKIQRLDHDIGNTGREYLTSSEYRYKKEVDKIKPHRLNDGGFYLIEDIL